MSPKSNKDKERDLLGTFAVPLSPSEERMVSRKLRALSEGETTQPKTENIIGKDQLPTIETAENLNIEVGEAIGVDEENSIRDSSSTMEESMGRLAIKHSINPRDKFEVVTPISADEAYGNLEEAVRRGMVDEVLRVASWYSEEAK